MEKKRSKYCTKKCKKCRGEKCPNYFGYIPDKTAYYSGILHSKKIQFEQMEQERNTLDRYDWALILLVISLFVFLTIAGKFILVI